MMMKMHGLGDGAYWLITYLWYLALYVIYIAILIIFGAAIKLEVFRRTNMGEHGCRSLSCPEVF